MTFTVKCKTIIISVNSSLNLSKTLTKMNDHRNDLLRLFIGLSSN